MEAEVRRRVPRMIVNSSVATKLFAAARSSIQKQQEECMSRLRFTYTLAMASALAIAASSARAQTWPEKPIRVVTAGTGGGLDLALRTIGQAVAPSLGQRFIVENRASSTRPEQVVLKSPADGYTMIYWANPLWLTPFLQDVNYDPVKDFA